MKHVIVTRFSVPRPESDPRHRSAHSEIGWLDYRLELFRRFFVPSVGRLGVPVVLLCSPQSSQYVGDSIRDLAWARVQLQDDWYGGWTGQPDEILTRLDSDDAVHEGWFPAVERALVQAEVACSKSFLRFDVRRGKAYRYRRSQPSPLAAFQGGRNPYSHDHAKLERHYSTVSLPEPYLLQVVHGRNLSNRFPKPFRRRARPAELEPFGLRP